MSNMAIDIDRGVLINIHQPTGMYVYMFVDEPGVYYNAYGKVLPEKIAGEAGFNLTKFGKERVKRERMAKAMAAIEAELEAKQGAEKEVVFEIEGFKVVDIGLGRHQVEDPDGNLLTPQPVPLEQAKALVNALTKDDKPAEEKAEKKGK